MPVRPRRPPGGLDAELAVDVRRAAIEAGCDAVGLASAAAFSDAQAVIEERKAAGLHGGMAFTYRKPERSTDPAATLPGARSLVVGARDYRRERPGRNEGALGEVARYSWSDHYEPLRAALAAAASVLTDRGWKAVVVVDDNAMVDRAAAHRAGIGWYGKNANILLPGLGSWFVLGSVITDAVLVDRDPAPLSTAEGCGPCDRCLTSCPTGALVAPGVLDARRCLAWLLEAPGVFPREHRVALGGRIYGCDDCQEVCPPNRLDARRRPAKPAEEGAEATVDLVEMLASSDEDLLRRFGRWYVPRRDPAALRRNALVALGNVGDGADPAVRATVAAALDDERELVRAHAVWAAGRLGLGALVAERMGAGDPSPLVRDELAEIVDQR